MQVCVPTGDWTFVDDSEKSSEFVVYLEGQTLRADSKPTGSLDKFETIQLPGTVTLEAGKIYNLILAAGETVQPGMLDIGAVRLVKQ